jgi:hypothetical protein
MSSAAGPLGSKFSHVDLVVSDLERGYPDGIKLELLHRPVE